MEDENVKRYIASMNKIIASGNPKYLSYVCKEYMTYKKNNPVLAMIIENMIRKEARDAGSVYAVLIDNDNGINLEAASDISKITNVADFIKNVDALSEQDVDFGDLTSDELIIEGMEIAEELAREIEEMENNIDSENITESETMESKIDSKTENALGKVTLFGAMAVSLKAIIESIRQRLNLTKNRLKGRIKSKANQNKERKEAEKEEANRKKENKVEENKVEEKSKVKFPNNDFIPKVTIDEGKIIKQMNENKSQVGKSKISEKGMSSEADDFDTTDDDNNDNNGTPEDDEPDI